jgi:hypothetical protein
MFSNEQQRMAKAYFASEEALSALCGFPTNEKPNDVKLWEETIEHLRIVKDNISKLYNR